MTSKSYGTISFNSRYNFFSSWKLETWNSFCITADTEARMYRTVINGEEVMALSDYEGTHQKRKGNIFLLNAAYKDSVFTYPIKVMMSIEKCDYSLSLQGSVTDVQIWDSFSDLARLQAWADCDQERESPAFIATSAPIHAAEYSQGETTNQGLGHKAHSGGEALPRCQPQP